MATRDPINLKSLTLDELVGVVNLYPWFGGARKELCLRMSRMGGDGWGENHFAESAMYMGSRGILSDLLRARETVDCSDSDVEGLIKKYMGEPELIQDEGKRQTDIRVASDPVRRVRAAGGDFFSQEDYDSVRKSEDGVFSSFAAKGEKTQAADIERNILNDFCTETLARIYMEQGYYEQAKFIYSKLILRYPEKSSYFATLIAELDKNINNQ